MESIIAKLDENDWKYFANEDLQNANNKIEELNKQKAQTQDTEIIKGFIIRNFNLIWFRK